MTAYQVTRTEQTEQGTVYVMNNGESVLRLADGRELLGTCPGVENIDLDVTWIGGSRNE